MAKLISADLTNNKLCILEYTTTDGQMLSFKKDAFDAKIASHTYTDKGKIIFDKPITRIGEWAFCFYSSLTSVTIPDSVTTIGERAFSGCGSLKEFNGKFASEDGRCLIVDGTLNSSAPAGLTEYTIPNSVTTIGYSAFNSCSSLTSVTIPDSVTSIGDYAFRNCNSLTSVTIPDSVTSIGNYAFVRCSSLTSVTIPNSVTAIGEGAFWWCSSLTSVTIPDSVTTIGESAFSRCSSLKEIKGKFASEDGRCLIVNGTLNSFAPAGLTEYSIPNSVTSIGNSAFSGRSSLTSVIIPDSVTSIGNYAFSGCSSLTSVTIPDSVTTIGNYAFVRCCSLTSVTIGKSVSKIGKEAFKECNIDTIVCCPQVPPKLNNSFGEFENLIVPTGCEEAYANSDWGQYLE